MVYYSQTVPDITRIRNYNESERFRIDGKIYPDKSDWW